MANRKRGYGIGYCAWVATLALLCFAVASHFQRRTLKTASWVRYSRDWKPVVEKMMSLSGERALEYGKSAGLKAIPAYGIDSRESYAISLVDPVTDVPVLDVTEVVCIFPADTQKKNEWNHKNHHR